MQATPSKRSAAWNAVFRLLAGLGILISLLGIGIDALPGGYPGLSLPQLLLTAAGLALALVAFAMRLTSATICWALTFTGIASDIRRLGIC